MLDTKQVLTVVAAWTSIVYTVCYVGVWLYPPIRDLFFTVALHASVPLTSGPFTLGTFILGLVIWNIMAALAVWLLVFLWNALKRS